MVLRFCCCIFPSLNGTQFVVQVAANITEAYIILGASDFLSLHASSVAKLLDLVVGNVNDRGLLSILPVIEILIQVFIFAITTYEIPHQRN